MDKFIVSARKYRPQTFESVVGQQHITTTLKNAIANSQLAHAYLFCGPRGVGKTTCARIFAKTINCENPDKNGEPCNECNSCKSFNEGTSLNIAELDAASNNSVEDIRTLVDQVRFVPQYGKYKVYIIDEVHMLSQAAFNAFLKTLEEPPSYVVFILATTEKHKILPTILSRCQIFDFKRITSDDTVMHLKGITDKEHITAEKSALQIIAQKSEGCMRDALSLMDKIVSFTGGHLTYANTLENLNILDEDYYFKLIDALLQQDLANVLLLNDEIYKKGFEGDTVLSGFSEFIRNILVAKNDKIRNTLLNVLEGMQEKYTSAAQKVSTSFLISALNILNESEINFRSTRNKRLHVEMTLIKLNYLMQALELSAGSDDLIKKKQLDGKLVVNRRSIPIYKMPDVDPTVVQVVQKATTPANTPTVATPSYQTTTVREPQATLVVEEPTVKTKVPVAKPVVPKSSTGTKGFLNKLKSKVSIDEQIQRPIENLEITKLQTVWNEIGAKLLAEEKHSAGQTFLASNLRILNEHTFEVGVNALTQQKFIEQDRSYFNNYVQEAFNNRNIVFSIIIEAGSEPDIPIQKKMNSQERFEYLSEKYPLLRDLKSKLNLSVDF